MNNLLREGQPLSPREREVCCFVALGLSNKEIAHALRINENTVKMHLHACHRKLGFARRTQIVAWILAGDRAPRLQYAKTVTDLVARGYSDNKIADQLAMTPSMVRSWIIAACLQLGVHGGRPALMARAAQMEPA